MSRPQTGIADDQQERYMVLEAIDFVLAKVGHLSGHNLVGECLLQLVHDTPHRLDIIAYVLAVQALEGTFHVEYSSA